MANSLSLSFVLLLVSTICTVVSAITQVTSTVAKDLAPCTMCTECENPCQLPPPPPPVVECPPPPSPSPPPPSPSPPQPPAVVECPPPPTCTNNCEMPQQGPPYPLGSTYFPPGTPYGYYVPDNVRNGGAKMKPLQGLFFWNPSSYSVYFFIVWYCFFI